MRRVLKLVISICILGIIFCNNTNTTGADLYDYQVSPSKNYRIITELKGLIFDRKTIEISKKDFIELIQKPLAFTLVCDEGIYGGMISNDKKLMIFPLNKIDETEIQEITIINLPNILSNNIRMDYIFSYTKDRLEDRIIIFDDEKKIIISMAQDINGDYIEIKNAIKFNSDFTLVNLKAICGYTENNVLRWIFSKNDLVYVVENNTKKLLKTKRFKNWNTLYGYRRKAERQNTVDSVYLYQVNGRVLRKYDFIKDKTIYELNLNDTPIKGKIVKIEVKLDSIFILTEFDNKSILYKSNEKLFDWFSYTDVFEDYTKFGKIESIYYFSTEKGQMWLGLFQKNAHSPIKLIDITSHVWKEIRPESEQMDKNDMDTKHNAITKVITDIAKWNHPTKGIFRKYGYNLTKIEFTNNNTYPIFYVDNDLDLVFSNEPFIEELANKNGYWDFTIKIGIQSLEVTCNKKQKKVVNKHIIVEL